MTWDEIFEWMNVDSDNEIWFDNIDDIKQAVEFIRQDGWMVNFSIYIDDVFLDRSPSNYLGLWFNSDNGEFVIGLRHYETDLESANVIYYSNYPFATSQVNIDVDQLNSLF